MAPNRPTGHPWRQVSYLACLLLLLAALPGWLIAHTAVTSTSWSFGSGSAPQLHVSGNKLVDASGGQVVLRGVNRSGTEFECVQNHGIFDGPSNQASITPMKRWKINAVRVPLNEACWNGESYVNAPFAAAHYRAAIKSYVKLLNSNGIVVIVDLHWTDGRYTGNSYECKSARAVCEKPMPDAAESIAFWSSVAATFRGDNAVIFDLLNEPYPNAAMRTWSAAWRCWRNGGSSCEPGIPYRVAGMQTLIDTIRSTGASNVIMLGGLAFANNLNGWSKYEPNDPDQNLVASWHSYNFDVCRSPSCWSSQLSYVFEKVPVIAGEIGETDCKDDYIDSLMAWLDSRSISYLAWAWNADWNCSAGPSLITSYGGNPTPYGRGYELHLQSLARQ
jgi:endoglucanase